jgi:transcriptional regulator with XRE-family HTH domain
MAKPNRRRKRWPKGTWMKLRSREILIAFMDDKEFSTGRLAQYAGCSRSFIGHLRSGHKTSCTPQLAERIAEALDVPTVGLFDQRASSVSSKNNKRQATAA